MMYPWQQTAWQELVKSWDNKPNAWLFYGPKQVGKLAFVRQYGQAILCEQPILGCYLPCGSCQSCHLWLQQTHPDFYFISGLEDKDNSKTKDKDKGPAVPNIKIEAIREVASTIQTSSCLGGWKVVLLEPAEAMNVQAANALLKILEEPPDRTIFLLVSHAKEKLLATIISRCRQFAMPIPSDQESLEYLATLPDFDDSSHFRLAFNSGMPFLDEHFPVALYQQFLQLVVQPRLLQCLEFAQAYEKELNSLTYFFDWFYKWVTDIILSKQGYSVKFNIQLSDEINQKIRDKYTFDDLFSMLESVQSLAKFSHHPLNIKLQIESILLEYLLLSIR